MTKMLNYKYFILNILKSYYLTNSLWILCLSSRLTCLFYMFKYSMLIELLCSWQLGLPQHPTHPNPSTKKPRPRGTITFFSLIFFLLFIFICWVLQCFNCCFSWVKCVLGCFYKYFYILGYCPVYLYLIALSSHVCQLLHVHFYSMFL